MTGVIVTGIVEQAMPVWMGYVGKVCSYVGSVKTYTPEFVEFVTEHYPGFLHMLGL